MIHRATVLVVDDTKANIDFFVEHLDKDYEIFVALDGQTALDIVDTNNINLILLDVQMPNMNGYEVCKQLKINDKTKDIPIIFITANSDETSISNAYEAGGVDYIVNPFKAKELQARVKTQIILAQNTQELKILNYSLEERVSFEVEQNRQKDVLLFKQSRLAQMGEMMSMIAHQWRQPLSAISSTSTSLELQLQLNTIKKDKIIKMAQDISGFTQHLSATIDDFRNFFMQDKVKHSATYSEIINSVLSISKSAIENQNINLILDLQSTQTFTTYINEVKQVILNLIQNAEDALLDNNIKNPQITIQTFDNILIVKDNASGIPEDIIESIFDPYFSTKLSKNGTGLGLYMSKTIIEKHCGGDISVINDKDGAIFTITLNE